MRLHSDRVDARIGSPASSQLLQFFYHVDFFIIDRLRKSHPCEFQPSRESINSDHTLGSQERSAANRKLADRPATPNGDGVTGLKVAVLGGHVTTGKNIRKE